MTLESDFYAVLAANSSLTAIVGDQIWPSHASDGATAPFVVYGPVFHEAIYALGGAGDLSRARMQVDCYAEDPDVAASIALAVIAALPESGRPIHRAGHTNQDLGLEEGTRLFRRMVEFSLFHRTS